MITNVSSPRLTGKTALLLFSGGFDSTFVALALKEAHVPTVALIISYPNRPRKEEEASLQLATVIGFKEVINCTASLEDFRLRQETWSSEGHEGWIPFRNAIFFSIAAHYSLMRDCNIIASGIRVWDQFWFNDSTLTYLLRLERLLRISGLASHNLAFEFYMPLAESHDPIATFVEDHQELIPILARTWSCWRDRPLPCGHCDPCKARQSFLTTTNIPLYLD